MVLSGALCFRWVFGHLIWWCPPKSEFQVDKKGCSLIWAITGSWEDGTNTVLGVLLAFFRLGKNWAGSSQVPNSKCVGWGLGQVTRQSRAAACVIFGEESQVSLREIHYCLPWEWIAISPASVLIPPGSLLGMGITVPRWYALSSKCYYRFYSSRWQCSLLSLNSVYNFSALCICSYYNHIFNKLNWKY